MKELIFRNRYTLLLTVLTVYIAVVVTEGAITDRQPDFLELDNALFSVNLRNLVDIDP